MRVERCDRDMQEFTEHQRLFLAAVCQHFHETGTWPTYGLLDKTLRQHKSLDVEEVGKDLDNFIHDSIHAPLSGWDPKQTIAMNVSALYECRKQGIYPQLAAELSAFEDVIRLCIERYEAGKDEESITSADLLDRDMLSIGMYDDVIDHMIQLINVEGFCQSSTSNSDGAVRWTFTMPRSIRKYRDVKTIEDYLTVRKTLQVKDWNLVKVIPRSDAISKYRIRPSTAEALSLIPLQPIQDVTDFENLLPTTPATRSVSRPRVFVSHSSKDLSFASKLVEHLNAAGAQAWMDVNDLGAGNFQQRISKTLDECEWFVLVLTNNALASQWVQQEVDAANMLKNQGQIRDLIFIKANTVKHRDLPALWRIYQVFDGVEDYGTALIRTLKAVGLLGEG